MANYCSKCGTRIAEDSRFCPKCGAPVETGGPDVRGGPAARRQGLPAGAVAGIIVGAGLVAALALFVFFRFMLPSRADGGQTGVSSPPEEESSQPAQAAAVPGQDPQFAYLRGLDMTFDQLAEEGYFAGDELGDAQLYTFNRFGDEAQFVMAREGLSGESVPAALRTTLDKVFPDLVGLSAKEAEEKYVPYLTVSYSAGDSAQGAYETGLYLYTIYPDTSGTLAEENVVEIKKKGVAPVVSSDPPAEGSAAPVEGADSNYYILPQSSQRLITYVDIQDFTKQDMMLARNEIFARHGRIFSDEEVRSYFEAQSWYNGTIAPEDFDTSMLSAIEQKNISFIKEYENGLNGVSQQVGNYGWVVTYNGYMIPQSSSRRLTYADVAGLSSWQLTIARNEIYARHGRMFDDPDIRAYFEAQPWYYGYILPGDFDASVLSATEQYNIGFIKSYE